MRRHPWGLFLALPVVAVLALAGCQADDSGDSGVATAGGGGGAQPSPSAAAMSDDERGLKFAACLREQGLDVPDPQPGQNGPRFNSGAEVDRSKMQAAFEQCREFAPNGGQPRELDASQVEQVRKLAKCMRENGVPNFPDPAPDGRMQPGPAGIEFNDPAVRAAFDKCQETVPNFGGRRGAS
ncbi:MULTISPECIES: hypothetical protein [Micromonospora]|uniref:Lipoprotein n=1 Tax=Micromonospora yangpuensis TaxID=683228 RepID=A0A1C6VD80_9ACTN|nr:hypothetical protein [Micromonospora yangpuensis]GGM13649.1 hypothetical protein GCM10012279_34800 [Micromonospora yangpuensis]SCL64292.1 hypothetical protein GA0070617_5435 [Micromonospora yangpuensis]